MNGLKEFQTNSDGTPNMFSVFKRKFKSSEESDRTDGQTVDGDREIDDKEIDMYLRDEKEIKIIKKLKTFAKLQSESDDISDDDL